MEGALVAEPPVAAAAAFAAVAVAYAVVAEATRNQTRRAQRR